MRPAPEKYRGLEFSIYAGAFVFGVVMSSLGSILPALFDGIGFEKADAGRLFLTMNFFMLLGSLVFGPVCDRFGFRRLLMFSSLLIGGAFGALAAAGRYGHILAALAALGFGGGTMNGGTNALINDISPERRRSSLNLLGIFFGIGALLTPFLIGTLLDRLGITPDPDLSAGHVDCPVSAVPERRVSGSQTRRWILAGGTAFCPGESAAFSFGFLLFFQSGNGFTIGGWVSTYLGERFGLSGSVSAYVLAGYWAAVMVGRLLVSRFGGRIASSTLVLGSSVLALTGCLGLILAGPQAAVCASVVLIGLGFAAIFPTTLAQAGTVFPEYSGTAFSVILVMALSGGMSAPWLVGRIAQTHGVGAGFWITASSCAAIAVLQVIIRLRGRQPQH